MLKLTRREILKPLVFFVGTTASEDAKEMPDKKLLKLMIDELFAENEKIAS